MAATDLRDPPVLAATAPAGFRTQPHNVEAEQALLGAILVEQGFCSELQIKETLAEQLQFAPLEPDPAMFEDSRRRMRFYEQYGARVIEGTAYATPVGDPPIIARLRWIPWGRCGARTWCQS